MTDLPGGLTEPEELEPAQGSLRLASPDDAYDASAWEAATAAVLRKGRKLREDEPDSAVWDKLSRTTLDGIAVAPIGSLESVADLATSGRPDRSGDWDIRTHYSGPDAKSANEAALVDLENGSTSLWVQLGAGLAAADLAPLLEGVFIDLAPVVLQHGDVEAAKALLSVADDAGVDLHQLTNLGADPLDPDLAEIGLLARDHGILGVVADATVVHDRGASDAQELGYSMAVGVAALRTLTDAGLSLDEAAHLIEFRYAATDEQFPTIAKLRAARRLWARVLELSGGSEVLQRQHVVTSRPMMSKYDPWVNMLRSTVGAFAAGVGGAEAVTVVPFDEPLGLPDALGRRVARNTSSLLISESHVAKVSDPAGGSYAVERLTDDLAAAAWAVFTDLDGGGSLDEAIAATVEARDALIANRTMPLTGLSEFPHLGETLPPRQPSNAAATVRRYGAAFEALRDDPPTGRVFLATMGSVAAYTARATFATNLFATGGIAVDVAGPTTDVASVLAAYDGQSVVCLAGIDAAYAEWGTPLAQALRAAGATHVIVAGKPIDGVDAACAMGVDALSFVTTVREKLA